jgi:hypothetical protein
VIVIIIIVIIIIINHLFMDINLDVSDERLGFLFVCIIRMH